MREGREIERKGDSRGRDGKDGMEERGEETLVTYVIHDERAKLSARYHLSSGKWYSNARPRLFFTRVDFYNARYYSLPLHPLSSR